MLLFLRLRRRRRLLLDWPIPCATGWLLYCTSPSCGPADAGEPWYDCTSGTFCSEVMLPLPIALKRNYRFDPTPALLREDHEARTKPVFQRRGKRSQVVTQIGLLLLPSRCDKPTTFRCYAQLKRLNPAFPSPS